MSTVITIAATTLEVAGIVVIVGGALVALVLTGRALIRDGASPFRRFRQGLGRAILLGLEFLVAADIVRTVSDIPSLTDVLILAIIVLIRTFLSFTLEVELEGSWPWQQEKSQPA